MTNIKYAYAWSTDNAKFRDVLCDEGIYYFRNKSNNKYLTCDNSNSQSLISNFSGNTNQSWIMLFNSSNEYLIKSASGTQFGMKIGTTISGNYRHFNEGNSNECSAVTLVQNEDQTFSFLQIYNNTIYALGMYSNYAAWSPYNMNSNAQRWYMEAQQLRRGDVNYDGYIDQSDYSIVQNHINHSATLNININKFLADADLNHVIDVTDLYYINNGLC